MASVAGVSPVRDRLAYTTTKFAVVGMTKALALDHSHTGVRFQLHLPGARRNSICSGAAQRISRKRHIVNGLNPVDRANGEPEEVAAAALYLAADESAMITEQL